MIPAPARDVVVVGGDSIALATALGLARAGLDVELLDTSRPQRLHSTGVHHWSTLPLLDDLGVLDRVLAMGRAVRSWGLRVLETGEQITYSLDEVVGHVDHPYHLRLEEPALSRVLAEALESTPAACRRSAVRVEGITQHDGSVAVDVHDGRAARRVHARWVVAADGTSSAVRRETGVGFVGSTWSERCVVALVEHDFGPLGYADTTLQVDGTYGAVVENVDDRRWRYVYLEPLARPEETVRERIPEVLRRVTARPPRIVDWTTHRMHERCATTFRAGRVLLVGAAAHVTHSLIGHSSISAWFDAATLGHTLADVVGGRAGEEALTAWSDERRRVYRDEVLPLSLARKNLVSQLTDPRRLDIELDQYRRAVHDVDVRREVLLQGRELAGNHRGALARG